MKNTKRLGIWMDHSTANLIEITDDNTETTEVEAQVGEQDEPLNARDETMIQNKDQNELADFYKRISEVIKGYDEVLLFGPTHAKDELNNILKDDRHFDEVKIEIKSADNMTENQQQAFVKEHFDING
jgi:predicted Zn-ribbon and HTH transcriptional regulator